VILVVDRATRLSQQEDPKIPDRTALVVTAFPGATALQVEQLVSERLEKKISELDSVEEITSQSRAGVSVITVDLRPARQARIEQDWDKLRARLAEVRLPEGALAPRLDTDFGNTVTVLFGVASPPATDARWQGDLIREQLERSQGAAPGASRYRRWRGAIATDGGTFCSRRTEGSHIRSIRANRSSRRRDDGDRTSCEFRASRASPGRTELPPGGGGPAADPRAARRGTATGARAAADAFEDELKR
jgi:hypothetical protein